MYKNNGIDRLIDNSTVKDLEFLILADLAYERFETDVESRMTLIYTNKINKISHGKTRIKKLHEEHKDRKIRTTKEKVKTTSTAFGIFL
jgi:hypothetical protein